MRYTITILPQAQNDIRSLPRKDQRRIVNRIRRLAEDPRPQGARPLRGKRAKQEGLWRWRSGDYRIIYKIADRELVVVIVRVGHRKDVYERFR
jgi:mRNA interferase RelE/StbE